MNRKLIQSLNSKRTQMQTGDVAEVVACLRGSDFKPEYWGKRKRPMQKEGTDAKLLSWF
jgi:hypothetical protein